MNKERQENDFSSGAVVWRLGSTARLPKLFRFECLRTCVVSKYLLLASREETWLRLHFLGLTGIFPCSSRCISSASNSVLACWHSTNHGCNTWLRCLSLQYSINWKLGRKISDHFVDSTMIAILYSSRAFFSWLRYNVFKKHVKQCNRRLEICYDFTLCMMRIRRCFMGRRLCKF